MDDLSQTHLQVFDLVTICVVIKHLIKTTYQTKGYFTSEYKFQSVMAGILTPQLVL